MQAVQAPIEGAPTVHASPPRQKPSSLASIAISSFASFRSQTAALPVPATQSPVRRKPLPANSPIAGRFTADQSNPPSYAAAADKLNSLPSQSLRIPGSVLSPPLTDDDSFLPRNLDE